MEKPILMLLILRGVLKLISAVILGWQRNRKQVCWPREEKNNFGVCVAVWGGSQAWPLSRWWIEMTQNVDRLLVLRWPDTTVTEVITARKQGQLKLSHLPNKGGKGGKLLYLFYLIWINFGRMVELEINYRFLLLLARFSNNNITVYGILRIISEQILSQNLWL